MEAIQRHPALGRQDRRAHRRNPTQALQLKLFHINEKKCSPLNAAGQAAKKERPVRRGGQARRSKPLCGFASLRLCVNKKKNVSQRREAAKIKTPWRLCFSAPLREQKKNVSQRREVAMIKTPWRLCSSAPLREQKKECLPVRPGGLDRQALRELFF